MPLLISLPRLSCLLILVFQEAVVPILISLPRLSCLLILVFQEAVVPLLISLPRLTSLTLEKRGSDHGSDPLI